MSYRFWYVTEKLEQRTNQYINFFLAKTWQKGWHRGPKSLCNGGLKRTCNTKWVMTILHENIGPICFSSQTTLLLYAICTTHYELQFPSGNKFLFCCTPTALCCLCLSELPQRINGSIFFLNCKKKSLEFGMSLCLCFCSLLKK